MKKLVVVALLFFPLLFAQGAGAQDNSHGKIPRPIGMGKAYCTRLEDAVKVLVQAPQSKPASCTVMKQEEPAEFEEMPAWQNGKKGAPSDKWVFEADFRENGKPVTAYVLFSGSN